MVQGVHEAARRAEGGMIGKFRDITALDSLMSGKNEAMEKMA